MSKRGTLAFYGIAGHLSSNPHATTHDHNLCWMQGGKVVKYLQLERYSRQKYDNDLAAHWEAILDDWNVPANTDFISVDSFVGTAFKTPKFKHSFQRGALRPAPWPATAQWEGKELPAWGISQELAHLGSCLPFFGPFRENSLLIHFDGGAGQSNFSAWSYRKGRLSLLEAHWDLVQQSKLFNANPLIFEVLKASRSEHCAVPGKLMGYAAYGKVDAAILKWLEEYAYFEHYWGQTEAVLAATSRFLGKKVVCFDNQHPFWQQVAAAYQYRFEQALLQKVAQLQQGYDYLYYTGGCALNIVANRKLWKTGWFEELFIPPCCNDTGLSLGAAAWVEWKKRGGIQRHSPYLQSTGAEQPCSASSSTIARMAECLAAGGIIGLYCGAGEVGPRALGHRSLLARPDQATVVERLSKEAKKRDWYRPLAPVMLEAQAQRVTGMALPQIAEYMLMDFPILPVYRKALEGVVHQNGTARIQCLRARKQHPLLYDLLEYCWKKYGWYGLVNTSFNLAGQPMVQRPGEARDAAESMRVEGLFVEGKFQELPKQGPVNVKQNYA